MTRIVRLLVLALALGAGLVLAQEFPRQPIRIIVPFPPGTNADMVSRLVAEELKSSLGQPVTVENRSGATGLVGVGSLARAPADGYTIGMGNEATHVTVPLLKGRVAYDPVMDFTPLTIAIRSTMAIAVNPTVLPVKNLPELLEAARKRPGGLQFGALAEGSPQQLVGELLRQRTGAGFVHVPYPGSVDAVSDAVAGKVPMVIATLPILMAQHEKLRIIAIGDAARLPALPGVQTLNETLPDLVVTGWSGYFAPANVPPAVAAKLSAALTAALHKPAVAEAIRKHSLEPAGTSPEELRDLVKSGLEQWKPVLEQVRLKSQE